MTRSAFLLKLLAVVGIGQSAQPPCHPKGVITNVFESTPECPSSKPECGEGESRCPMGHCQKPRVVNLQATIKAPCMRYNFDGTLVDDGTPCTVASGNFEQHVCSVCGVCYVPINSTFSK